MAHARGKTLRKVAFPIGGIGSGMFCPFSLPCSFNIEQYIFEELSYIQQIAEGIGQQRDSINPDRLRAGRLHPGARLVEVLADRKLAKVV